MTKLRGRVASEPVDVGSKSERVALVLHAGDDSYVLRLAGGESFTGAELAHLVGETIEADGELHEQYFDVRSWAVGEAGQ